MIILLGSGSESKKIILQNALGNILKNEFKIIPLAADSGISEQPLDLETTKIGAVNRAYGAVEKHPESFDFSFGMEGGLEMKGGIYYLVCVAAVLDKEGRTAIGSSAPCALPREVSDEVAGGGEFGKSIREYHDKMISGMAEKRYVSDLIERKKGFLEAVSEAWTRHSRSC